MALDLPGAAASALQGMPGMPGGQPDQSPAQAPVYQAPPAPLPPTFFGRLLQGALNGLAGGVKQGQENIAGAGTPGFKPGGNGMAYAQEAQQQQDQAVAQKQQAAQQQAQQQFQNQNETFKNNQQAQLQSAQSAEIKLRNIQAVQNIQHADEATQDAHFTDSMKQMNDAIEENGGKELDHIKMGAGTSIHDASAAYLDQHPGFMADGTKHLAFSRDADGEVEVHVYQADPNARVSAARINASMKAVGSPYRVPDDTDMSNHEYKQTLAIEQGKQADFNHQVALKKIEAQQQSALESQRQGGEMQLEKQKEAAANLTQGGADSDPTKPLDPTLETLVDSVHNGHATPAQVTKGMGTKAVAGNRAMQARYESKYMNPSSPDYDPHAQTWQAAEGNYKAAYNDKNTQNVQSAGDLLGTKDPVSGKQLTQGQIPAMRNKMANLQAAHPALFSTGPTARAATSALEFAGNAQVEDLMNTAPDIAMAYAKFASGGNPSSDATYKATVAAIQRARTPAALKAVFDGLDDVAGARLGGMRQNNPALAARLNGVVDPGTHNDKNNEQTPAAGRPTAGPGQKVVERTMNGVKEYKVVPK
jgi:hypothetical protein